MALPELLEALRAQAAERRAEELARADAEAERIRAALRASVESRKAAHVERAVREATEAGRRSLAEARARSAESTLLARDRLLGRVRAALAERMGGALADPDYQVRLAAELTEALERLPRGEVIVRAGPELADVLGRVASGARGVVVETVRHRGPTGFVAVATEANIEIDATLETRLQHQWPRLAVSVLAEVPG